MRPDDSSYRRPGRPEPRASIVDLPNATRLKTRGAPDRTALVVIAIALLVAVAIMKPWESRPVASPPGLVAIASPTVAPDRDAGGLPHGLDWSLAAPHMTQRVDWGVRAIVLEADRPTADVTGAVPADVGKTRIEEIWTPAAPGEPGAPLRPPTLPGQVVSDAVLIPTRGAPVAAIGVTSPDAQPIFDVRVWQIVRGELVRIEPRDLPGPPPGIDRLLIPPSGLAPSGLWPPGLYRIDLLMGRKVLTVTVALPALVRDTAAIRQMTEQAAKLLPGPFEVRTAGPEQSAPYRIKSINVIASAPLSEAAAWLHLQGALGPKGSVVAELRSDPPILALGVRGAPGERLVSAILMDLSPAAFSVQGNDATTVGSADGDTAIFELGSGGLAPGLYRIESSWFKDGAGDARSWHLDVRGPDAPDDSGAPFLAAARAWAAYGGQSVVLSEGAAPIPQGSDRVLPDVVRLGSRCAGGAMLDNKQRVIGLGYAGGRPSSVRVDRLYSGARTRVVSAAIAADTVPGLILMGQSRSTVWAPGYYEITVSYPSRTDHFVFCVGVPDGSGQPTMPDGVATNAAYDAGR